MNAATEFDLGPLTWVKGEIDLALERALAALGQYESTADPTQLKFCRTHVHQVHGALAIVGLDGVTRVSESLESLLTEFEGGQKHPDEQTLATLRQAFAGLQQYLDDLLAGEPNQPLRLLPVYQALATARGEVACDASELFYPDLSIRAPRRGVAPKILAPEQFKAALKAERMRYQKGLLSWLRKPAEAEAGRQLMREAVAGIEAQMSAPATRSFWWVTLAFFDALADPKLAADPAAHQLCSAFDAQIRRLLEGSAHVAERLMRAALYHLAHAPATISPLVAEVQARYAVADLLPTAALESAPEPRDGTLRRLREVLGAAEDLWNKFCTGNAASLPAFAEQARQCAQLTAEIGHTDLKRLGQGLGAVANWLVEAPSRQSDGVAMEVATAILLLQNAQEGFKRLGTDFAQQVDLMVARLYACIAGKPVASDQAIPLLDEMTRQAQERLLIGQVGREIQNNLGQIEQALDSYFRDPEKAHDLSMLDGSLKQVAGALAMLGHFSAVKRLQDCAEHIRQFTAEASAEAFEAVANELSLIGFFVDALQSGETDFDAFVSRMRGEKPQSDEMEEAEVELAPAQSIEKALAKQTRETQVLVEALKKTPEDARLQNELKQNLQAIQKDADLVANRGLGDSAKAALAAMQTGTMADEAVGAALSGLKPSVSEAQPPSAETLQLAESSHEEIDAELLEIFLEEAAEVLDTLGEQLALLTATPNSTDALTTIRRSTHTLKGSGRMVGLVELGDVAWELEQTINLWLRQDMPATPELLKMLEEQHAVFCRWVAHLETGQGLVPDTAALLALARQLRGIEPIAALAAQPEPAAAPEMPVAEESQLVDPELPISDEIDLDAASEPVEDAHLTATAEALEDLLVPEETLLRSTPENDEIPPSVTASPTLYSIFVEEARGHLDTLQASYAVLDAHPASPTTFEMTRAAHTLGGIAATVGLLPLNHLAIELEHALLRRDGSGQAESVGGLETVRQTILTLEEMFAGLAQGQAPEEQAQLRAALADIFVAAPLADLPVEELAEAPTDSTSAEIITLPGAGTAIEQELPAEASLPPLLTDELDEQLLPLFLEEAADQLRELTVQTRTWLANPAAEAPPRAIARLLHTFKGNARMAGALNLGEVTHLLETRIEETVRAGQVSPAFIEELEGRCDLLAQAVEVLREGTQAPAEPPVVTTAEVISLPQKAAPAVPLVEPEPEVDTQQQRATLRVRADLIDRLVNEAGELSIARARIEGEMRSLKGSLLDLTENVIRLRRQLREIEIQAESQIQARTALSVHGQAEFDPLELDRFTRFQELTRFMAESVNDVATVQQNLLKNLDDANAAILAQSRLNRGLQQELMNVRMVPFASQAERLYRIVRQTAKEVGKRANLDIAGGQVEIDRSVLDKMLGPIEHMLRNAVTHGIETREQRLASGKREVGEISLSLTQEGNEIILAMADDGKGLDAERIRARAEAMGLLEPGQAIDDAALYDFIFQPGFSTATELTQVSGRGVGTDVVRTEVTALGGRIELHSQPGQGTTFRLYLPLTLAVTQTLLLRVGNQRYAVPSNMIEQVLELKEKQLAVIQEAGEAEWQGHHYPFHFLAHLLGDRDAQPEVRRRYWVLLLRSGTQRVAVQVDELKGNQEVVVKNIGAQLSRVVGIAGATVLGDGQVVLILNPVALLSRAAVSLTSDGLAPEALPSRAVPKLPTVMVVDDSLTVRKITSRLLAREGYQVILAKDGVDALEQLLDETPDVILSDIEMPRMDGFDLLRNIRADARLKALPVIMITSRTADKHRNYALEIGADHYLGKPYDEDELLGLVAAYCKKD